VTNSAPDLENMTPEEIETYAIEQVRLSGDPEADPQPLIDAMKNTVAYETAMQDPYWKDLVSIETYKMAGMNYDPLSGAVTPITEETK
jgi:hypothetical protein